MRDETPSQNRDQRPQREDSLLLRTVIDESVEALLVIDHQGIVQFSNPAADLMIRGKTDRLVGFFLEKPVSKDPVVMEFLAGTEKRHMEMSAKEIQWKGQVAFLVSLRDITARKTTEDQLDRFFRAVEQSSGSIVITDASGAIEYVNPKFTEITGYTLRDVSGKNPRLLQSGLTPQEVYRSMWETVCAGREWRGEFLNKKKNGRFFWEAASISAVRDENGTITNFVAVKEDITERKRSEMRLERSNRELRAIRKCNQTLLRAEDEQTLLNDVCRIVCDEMKHRFAWVGYVEHDAAKSIRPVAWAGFNNGYLEAARLTWGDTDRGGGPGGIAVRTGQIAYIHDCQSDPRVGPWRESMLQRGFRSIIVLPLKDEHDHTFAIFPIYSAEFNAFTPEEIRLLQELADDLAFGLITLRTRADRERIQKEASELAAIVQSSEDAIIGATLDGVITSWNRASERIFGFAAEEVVGKSIATLVPPDRSDEIPLLLGKVKAAEHVERLETVRNKKDGRVTYVSLVCSAVRGTDGNIIGTSTIARDITRQQQLEMMHRAIYEMSQATYASEDIHDLYKSLHAIIKTVMPARNFCISFYDEEHDALTFPYCVDEEETGCQPRKAGQGVIEHVLRTGRPLLVDGTDVLPAGGPVEIVKDDVQASVWLGVPLKLENRTIGVIALRHHAHPRVYGQRELEMLEYLSSQVMKAIEHKRAEERLRQSEEQFRLITENAADLIAVLDVNGKRIYNSPSFKRVFGEDYQFHGTDAFADIHPDDRQRIQKVFAEAIRAGKDQQADFRYLLKDGKIRYIESHGSLVQNAAGEVEKVVIVSRDVTEKKMLEQQFLRAQRMESVGTLAAGVAHDLNNVLGPILMAVDLIRKRINDEAALNVLDMIETSAMRGRDIVKQVLVFGRGVAGERIVLQPKHIIREVLGIAIQTFPKSIEIIDRTPKNLAGILADPTQIQQALLNMCVNARDAMPNGGKLTIAAENVTVDENYARMNIEAKAGTYVTISIIDSGVGIPLEIRDRIFEPFFTTKDIGKGTGLGLSTTLAIIKSHQGFVTVASEAGRGTTFRIYLPTHHDVQTSVAEQHKPVLPPGNAELVLVIDDEEAIREVTRKTLETHGYKVVTAGHGAEGVALFAEHKAAVKAVITDIMMPVMDGYATIRAVRALDPTVAIVATSGISDGARLMSASDVGAQGFLMKPYTAEKLLVMLHALLDI